MRGKKQIQIAFHSIQPKMNVQRVLIFII